jgi:hypothetical protein
MHTVDELPGTPRGMLAELLDRVPLMPFDPLPPRAATGLARSPRCRSCCASLSSPSPMPLTPLGVGALVIARVTLLVARPVGRLCVEPHAQVQVALARPSSPGRTVRHTARMSCPARGKQNAFRGDG